MRKGNGSRTSWLLAACIGTGVLMAQPHDAAASTVAGWWGGSWNCNIDGRPARMRWAAVDAGQTECDGSVCTSTSAVRWDGRFSDNGSRWVPLRSPQGAQGGFYFRHADGNRWYLAQPVAGRANGWTTWNGKRYPLACWH